MTEAKPISKKEAIGIMLFIGFAVIGAGYVVFLGVQWETTNYHTSTDQARVVKDNTYFCYNVICGTLVVHDLRNGFNYTVTPSCQYWHVSDMITISLNWGLAGGWSLPSEQQAIVYIANPPSGCA